MNYSVVILGATGFIGSGVVRQLLNNTSNASILSIGRRSTAIVDSRLTEILTPLEQLDDYKSQVCATVLVLALGSSLQQGSHYRQVDCDFGLKAATLARHNGVEHCIGVSSALASRWSPSAYLRSKARFERGLQALGFKRLTLLRPGPLTGRATQRWQEALLLPALKLLATLSTGTASPIDPINGADVALCIALLCQTQGQTQTLSSHEIQRMLATPISEKGTEPETR